MRVGVGPALVGEDRDGDVLVGQPADRRRERPRKRPEWPSVGWPAIATCLDAEPVRRRAACTARSAAMSPTIAARVAGSSAPPPYRARAQRTRSLEVVAIDPAAPAAVTTEVNGTTWVPSDRSMAGSFGSVPTKR